MRVIENSIAARGAEGLLFHSYHINGVIQKR